MPPGTGRPGRAAAQARRRDPLVGFTVAEEDLSDFEQRHVAQAPRRIATGRRDEPGQEARPHRREFRRDRVRELQFGRPPAEEPRLLVRYEAPGHGLQETLAGERALGKAGALLQQRQDGPGHAGVARQRLRLDAVETRDADDLLDEIGLAVDVRAPARHPRHDPAAVVGMADEVEAELLQNALHVGARQVEPGQARHLAHGEVDAMIGPRHLAGEAKIRRLATTEFENQRGGEIEARQAERGIDATLEPIPRIAGDPELSTRLGRGGRDPRAHSRSARRPCLPRNPRLRRP